MSELHAASKIGRAPGGNSGIWEAVIFCEPDRRAGADYCLGAVSNFFVVLLLLSLTLTEQGS